MLIRKATEEDLRAVERIYDDVHAAEEAGRQTIGWLRGVYPVRATAEAALARGDLFVLEDEGAVWGSGIINRIQGDVYCQARWLHEVEDARVCVLHTLVISPRRAGRGYGRAFLAFYERHAREMGCVALRIDTNAKNTAARTMYKRHGYAEVGVVPTEFNGIPGVHLVLLEKDLGD